MKARKWNTLNAWTGWMAVLCIRVQDYVDEVAEWEEENLYEYVPFIHVKCSLKMPCYKPSITNGTITSKPPLAKEPVIIILGSLNVLYILNSLSNYMDGFSISAASLSSSKSKEKDTHILCLFFAVGSRLHWGEFSAFFVFYFRPRFSLYILVSSDCLLRMNNCFVLFFLFFEWKISVVGLYWFKVIRFMGWFDGGGVMGGVGDTARNNV